jgi:tetratricopeptide (TPR) repeat protein
LQRLYVLGEWQTRIASDAANVDTATSYGRSRRAPSVDGCEPGSLCSNFTSFCEILACAEPTLAKLKPLAKGKTERPNKTKVSPPRLQTGWKAAWPALVPACLALATYCWSLNGKYVFDDVPTVEQNLTLETLGGWWDAAFGPKHSPISNRPVVCLTFCLNYAINGRDPFGYHLVNLLVHMANAALLWAVLRRALVAPNLGNRYDDAKATWTAAAIASVWAVHPLGSEAVVYITQRTTLIMSFFLLGTLYGVLRSVSDQAQAVFWQSVAVGSCALAMMSKEESVALPILVILFDRAFNYASFKQAFKERWPMYSGLAATWLLLILCVLLGPENPTVGYHRLPNASAFEWLMTETPVLLHYVRLTFWPAPLSVAYDWEVIRDLSQVFLQGMLILALIGGAVALWFWKPHWAWLGAWFFLLLAPTSSILPIISEVVAERRMYLPMLSLLIPAMLGLFWLVERVGRAVGVSAGTQAAWCAVPVGAAIVGGAIMAASHARVFADEFTLWSDVASKNDMKTGGFMSSSLLSGYAKVLLVEANRVKDNNMPRAVELYGQGIKLLERSRECVPFVPDAEINLAAAYVDVGRAQDALNLYLQMEQKGQTNPNFYANFGLFLQRIYQADAKENQKGASDQRLLKAEQLLNRAIELYPRESNFFNTRASIRYFLGKLPEAERDWQESLRLDPNNVSTVRNRAIVYVQQGRYAEAIPSLEALTRATPNDSLVVLHLAQAYQKLGNRGAALQWAQKLVQMAPNDPAAQQVLADIQAGK